MSLLEQVRQRGQGTSVLSQARSRLGINPEESSSSTIRWIEQKKKEEEIRTAREGEQKALQEFKDSQGGFAGTINRFLGMGSDVPIMVGQTPEETAQQLGISAKAPSLKENLGNVWQGIQDVVAGGTTESYKDIFLQPEADKEILRRIDLNNKFVKTAIQKKKENPEKSQFLDDFINKRIEENNQLAKEAGGKIKDKDTLTLIGQALTTGSELSMLLDPLVGLTLGGVKFVTKEGAELTSKAVTKMLTKEGIEAGTKEADNFLVKEGIKLSDQTVLKGEKLLSKEGVKNVLKSGPVAGGAVVGGTMGLGQGLENPNRTIGSVAKSTATGGIAGATLGGLFLGVGGLFGKLTAKRATNKIVGILEKDLGKLDSEEVSVVKEGIQSGLTKEEIKTGLEKSRADLEQVFGEKITTEKPKMENTKTEVDVEVPVKEQNPDLSKELNKKDYEKILKTKIDNVPEPKADEITVIQSGNSKYVDTQIDESLNRGVNNNTRVFNVKKSELNLTDNAEKNLRGERLMKEPIKTENVKVSSEQLPVGEGKIKTSKLESRVKTELDNAPKEIKDNISTYSQMSKPEQIKKASQYVSENSDEAMAVLRGEKEPPKGLLHNSIYVALMNLSKGDVDLATKLATLRSTRFGQEISILTELDKNNPVRWIKELFNRKIEVFGGQKRFDNYMRKATAKEKPAFNKAVRGNNLKSEDWSSFIESIKCK